MNQETPMPPSFDLSLDPRIVEQLQPVTTATLTTVLLKKGLRNVWIRGARPLEGGYGRTIARAFTLRFVPSREDLATPESWSSPISTRAAIEAMPLGCLAIVDAMGVQDAGIFGDILCARMAKKDIAGLITDGVVRDLAGVLGTGLPVWCSGIAARAPRLHRTFGGCQGFAQYAQISNVVGQQQDQAGVEGFALFVGQAIVRFDQRFVKVVPRREIAKKATARFVEIWIGLEQWGVHRRLSVQAWQVARAKACWRSASVM